MSESRASFKTVVLLGPLLAAVLALHAWGDGAADHVGRQVDLWQYPEISRGAFLLRFPRGSVAESWAPGVLAQYPEEILKAAPPMLDLHRPTEPVRVVLLAPDAASRRLAGEIGEGLKENESAFDAERRTILVKMGRTIEQSLVTSALHRGIARLLLHDAGSARWAPWLAEGLIGLLDGSRTSDLKGSFDDLPSLERVLTSFEADYRSRDGAAYARGARLLVAYLDEAYPIDFAAYCRASRDEGPVRLSHYIEHLGSNPMGEQAAWREWLQRQK